MSINYLNFFFLNLSIFSLINQQIFLIATSKLDFQYLTENHHLLISFKKMLGIFEKEAIRRFERGILLVS